MINNVKITKILSVIFIIVLILLIVAVIYRLTSKNVEKVMSNKLLNEEQSMTLMKAAIANLPNFDNNTVMISEDDMISFALNYMLVAENYDIVVDYESETAIAKVNDVRSVVKYIFDRDINYNNVTNIIEGENMEIPLREGSTDLEIYKLKSKEYDDNTGIYTATIDCIEPDIDNAVELKDPNTLEYSEQDIIGKAIFKYKEIDGRKVLLGYTLEERY